MNMEQSMKMLRKWAVIFDALSLRERILVLAAVAVAVHFVWDSALWQPVLDRQDKLKLQIEQQSGELAVLGTQLEVELAKMKKDPDAGAKTRLIKLQQQLDEQRRKAGELESTLIPPSRMAKMLEQMLNREAGLTLVSLRSLKSTPLLKPVIAKQKQGAAAAGMVVYRHSFEVEFEGDYFSTLEYLKALQELPWKFFWSRLDYTVGEYPTASVRLNLYTLSLSKEWIGV